MSLAGAHHITISPPLLKELSETEVQDAQGEYPSLFTKAEQEGWKVLEKADFFNNQEAYRRADRAAVRGLRGITGDPRLKEVRAAEAINTRRAITDELKQTGHRYLL